MTPSDQNPIPSLQQETEPVASTETVEAVAPSPVTAATADAPEPSRPASGTALAAPATATPASERAAPVPEAATAISDSATPASDAAMPVPDAALPVLDAALPVPDAAASSTPVSGERIQRELEETPAQPASTEAAPGESFRRTEQVQPAAAQESATGPAAAGENSTDASAGGGGEESFAELFAEYETAHKRPRAAEGGEGPRQIEGTVISIGQEFVYLDIGYKVEGAIPRADFEQNAEKIKPGDRIPVSIKGRTEEGYYALSRFKIAQPRDFTALEAAYSSKTPVTGVVTGVVKGGLTVDIGLRAFLPASRSGTRGAAEMEKLVGSEVAVLITKLDIADEDAVVDRRAVLEEQALLRAEGRRAALKPGDVVRGTVRSLMSYGAFIDLGGIDGLLHVGDMSWAHVNAPSDLLTAGQEIDVKILKIDPETKRIALGLKQLQPEPWATVPERYAIGQRVTGVVTRLADFGAFVEIEPGVEGLIHLSELSWTRKVKKPSDALKAGDQVEAVVLAIKPEERRLSLGLKQTLANPWLELAARYPIGSQITGPVTRLAPFGAFIQIEEGIEGLVHISEIVPGKRIHHPQEALKTGETVKAKVLSIDPEKRQSKRSIKQLVPTSTDEFFAAHSVGDQITGRVLSETQTEAGEGVIASIRPGAQAGSSAAPSSSEGRADLAALSSLLQSRWKGQDKSSSSTVEPLRPGQVRRFRITAIDPAAKKLEVEAL